MEVMSRRHQAGMWAGGGDAPTQRTPSAPHQSLHPSLQPPPISSHRGKQGHPCSPVPHVWDETSQNPFLLIPPGGPRARMPPQGYSARLARLRSPCILWSPLLPNF